MAKVISWTAESAKATLRKRLEAAKKYREKFESQMVSNYNLVNNVVNAPANNFGVSFDSMGGVGPREDDQASSRIGTNLAFKYLRWMHSQMSSNPPSAMAKATTTDPDDRRKADAADRMIRHAMREYDLQEVVDDANNKTLTYGIGWIKCIWDPNKGDISQFEDSTNDVTMEGDIDIYSPDTSDIWVDPDAKNLNKTRYVFECIHMSLEEALFLYPKFEADLKAIASSKAQRMSNLTDNHENNDYEQQVEIYEYYERGLPVNGMAGRFCRFLENYTLLQPPTRNPMPGARLPFHGLTYIDAIDQLYGKSILEYVAPLQTMLNKMDSSIVDNVQAHGVIRLLVPEGAEIEDEALSDSSWDWIKFSGQVPPKYINPPQLMPDLWQARNQLAASIQDLFGINDSQLGIQKREQSAVSQQTAIEQGTLIHRRLFKKYERTIYNLYKDILSHIKDNWTAPRCVMVIGKENAFEAMDFKGADISGGFDIKCEYGTSLPLDPNARRESIVLLTPILKEAGLSAKQILQYMKLNDLEGIYDRMELAAERQREVFEEMIAAVRKGIPPEEAYIAPEDLEEHAGRLEFAYTYLETVEFKYLPEPLKDMIRMHVKEREGMMGQTAAPADPAVLPAGMPGVGGSISPHVGTKAGSAPPTPAQSLAAAGVM